MNTMTMTKPTANEKRELTRVLKIVEPWIPVTIERELWTITLKSGREVEITAPLGAAVEIEERGFQIVASR